MFLATAQLVSSSRMDEDCRQAAFRTNLVKKQQQHWGRLELCQQGQEQQQQQQQQRQHDNKVENNKSNNVSMSTR